MNSASATINTTIEQIQDIFISVPLSITMPITPVTPAMMPQIGTTIQIPLVYLQNAQHDNVNQSINQSTNQQNTIILFTMKRSQSTKSLSDEMRSRDEHGNKKVSLTGNN
jgi:hypothetical protein